MFTCVIHRGLNSSPFLPGSSGTNWHSIRCPRAAFIPRNQELEMKEKAFVGSTQFRGCFIYSIFKKIKIECDYGSLEEVTWRWEVGGNISKGLKSGYFK